MKTKVFLLSAAVFASILAGCGGGSSAPAIVTVDVVSSDGTSDGDITFDPFLTAYTVMTTGAVDNVFVGTVVNPLDPANPLSDIESKGYFTFSLASIPVNASIQGATLIVRINAVDVLSGTNVAVVPSMVSFAPLDTLGPTTVANLFNDAQILTSTVSYQVFPADVGADIFMDVTDALIHAMNNGFSTLQIKMAKTAASSGRIVIDDFAAATAPTLRVDYF